MKYTFYLLLTASVLVLFYSCKKGDNEKLEGNNQTVSDYMSTKAGSWWLYGSSQGSGSQRKLVATGRDSFKLDRMYNYYETTDLHVQYTRAAYFAKNGDKFLTLMDIDNNETNYMPIIVQKDNAQVGDTWSNTGDISYSGMKFDLLAEGEVISTSEALVFGNHTFDSVVEVRNKLKAKVHLTPIYTNCGTVIMWFRKGVGILKADYDISISSFYSTKYVDSLLDYHVEP